MKSCPKCKRTYADDGFTFCLEDGALLSAPYGPSNEEPVSTIQSGGPPPTAVLPQATSESEASPPSLAPTIAAREPVNYPKPSPSDRSADGSFSWGTKKVVLVILAGGSVLILGIAAWAGLSASRCPAYSLRCSEVTGTSTYCYLVDSRTVVASGESAPLASLRPILGFQGPAPPPDIAEVKWEISRGTIDSDGVASAHVDLAGLSGGAALVKAHITSKQWLCSSVATQVILIPYASTPGK